MMGRKYREQANFFYEFRLDDMIPKGHLLRRINVFVTPVLGDLHEQLGPFYSAIGRPSTLANRSNCGCFHCQSVARLSDCRSSLPPVLHELHAVAFCRIKC